MNKNFKMVAKTLFGFEDILAKELKELGVFKLKEVIEVSLLRVILVSCTRPICV